MNAIVSSLRVFCFLLIPLTYCYNTVGETKIEIDFQTKHQIIEGFGSCIVNYKDFPETYYNSNFFDLVVDDLGISLIRVPMMEHTEWENDDADPDHFNWSGFWLKNNVHRQGIESSMWLMNRFKERGVERFMSTPWSPPEFMKTNRAPIQGGFLRADMVDEFAEYIAAQIILAKQNYGIDLRWVSLQNELLFIEFYRSCIYNPWLLKETVRSVSRKLKREGISTQILLPEDMMFVDRMLYYIKPTMGDPETSDFDGAFTTHRKDGKEGLLDWVANTQKYGRQNWMTETSGHPQTWSGALKLANDIQEYLVYGNFSAWVYWQLDSSVNNPGKYSILVGGEPTPKYYASKHFYKYIRPGARRLETSWENDELVVSSFLHEQDGTHTVVIVNNGQKDERVLLNTDQDYDVFLSHESIFWKSGGSVNSAERFMVPAKGIVTLVGNVGKSNQSKKRAFAGSILSKKYGGSELLGNSQAFPRKFGFQPKADGGNISILDDLKSQSVDDLTHFRAHNGWTLLHYTLLNGDGDSVKYLLEIGSDINAKANDGWTPLHMAASSFVGNAHKENRVEEFNKFELLQLVLKSGADISAKTTDGWTALHAAVANAHTGWRGNMNHSLSRITNLIAAGINVNERDVEGRTALHWAAMQGYFVFTGLPEIEDDVVVSLLNAGADINAVDNKGNSALHYAAQMGYPSIVETLISSEADLTIENLNKQTPEDILRISGNEKLLKFDRGNESTKRANLEAHRGDLIPHKNKVLGAALLKAAWDGNAEMVRELLAKGADSDFVDTDGFTAIDRAIDSGHLDIVKMINCYRESEDSKN